MARLSFAGVSARALASRRLLPEYFFPLAITLPADFYVQPRFLAEVLQALPTAFRVAVATTAKAGGRG